MSKTSTVRPRIYQAVVDIHNAGRVVTREAIGEHAGATLGAVDENLKILVEIEGTVRRVRPGVYEPAHQHGPNRPVSYTVLSEGIRLAEVGDKELRMTPGEAAVLARAMHGEAMQFARIEGERDVYDSVQTLKAALRAADKRMAEMARALAKMEQERRQDDLFTTA